MASLANQTISSTYDGLIKTSSDNAVPVSGVQALEDGSGNALALSVGRSGNGVTVSGNLAVDTNTLYVDAANNRVGVGTSSLGANKFTVLNNGDTSDVKISSDTLALLQLEDSGLSKVYNIEIGRSGTSGDLTFRSSEGEKVRFTESGNVGINCNPSVKLDVYRGSSGVVANFNGVNAYGAETGITLSQGRAKISGFLNTGGATPGSNLRFYTMPDSGSVTERMRIDSSGSVIIKEKAGAITPPSNGLSLLTGYGVSYLFSKSSGGTETDMFYNASNQIFNTGGSERMRITSGGQVLIGISTPNAAGGITMREGIGSTDYAMDFSGQAINQAKLVYMSSGQLTTSHGMMHFGVSNPGNGRYINFAAPDGSYNYADRGYIELSGTSVLYTSTSDYRLKENVVELTGALDRVDALKPSRFNFIGDNETIDGFIAHEVKEVVPQAVSGEKDAVDEEGNPIYQGIDQSKIVPLLVGAIKELRAEIETLKSQLNA